MMPPRSRFDLSTGAEEGEFHQETIGIITNQRRNHLREQLGVYGEAGRQRARYYH